MRYTPDTKTLEIRSGVNVKFKVRQHDMYHSAIQRGIHTLNLEFLPLLL